jgi:hypothetical protein
MALRRFHRFHIIVNLTLDVSQGISIDREPLITAFDEPLTIRHDSGDAAPERSRLLFIREFGHFVDIHLSYPPLLLVVRD